MSITVLVAFAGVLVAAVGTGLLGGRCIRNPRISFVAWTVASFALTVALLAQSIGFATGFAAWSFRVIQLSAQLVAPLMLAWGLAELVARTTAVRFGARLVTAALVVVAGVVLATDPLAARPFAKTWPAASAHYQVIPHFTLILAHLVVAVAAVVVAAVCGTRGSRGYAASAGPRLPAVAALAVAALLLVALRFTLPGPLYPGLGLIAAVLVWFGMSSLGDPTPGARPAAAGQGRPGSRSQRDAGAPDQARGSNRARDLRGNGPEPGDRLVARAAVADDLDVPGSLPAGRAAHRAGHRNQQPGDRDQQPWDHDQQQPWDRDQRSGHRTGGRVRPGRDRLDRDDPAGLRYQPGAPGAEPATGMFDVSVPGLPDLPLPIPASRPGTDVALPVTPPHGLIAIYTLLEDRVADFDRAADEVAERVRSSEPDTLVYVIHTVPKAPMQRIFYEVYRDRAAYERHEKQPYVERFVTARRPYVLATNVIELRLKYAKVSPLPQAEAQAAQAQAAQAQARTEAAGRGSRDTENPVNLPAVRAGSGERSTPDRGGGRPSSGGHSDRPPAYTPRDPGYPPREPGYPPRDPGSRPRDPGYPSRDPGARSRDRGSSRNRDQSQASGEPPAAPRFGRI